MTAKEVLAHLNEMADRSTVVALPELLDDHTISCVDGRKTDGVIGAPGGNMGLFILMLAAYEQFTGGSLSDEAISNLFARYLNRFGRFYMHTDQLAAAQLRERAAKDEFLATYVEGESLNLGAWIQNPPADARDRLLELLIQPDSLGCGHLRLLLEHPAEYRVRPELARAVLAFFFRRLWEGDDRLMLDVLEGVHEEEAVVCVRVEHPEGNQQGTVLTYPSYSNKDVFVYHPNAVRFLYAENARFMADAGVLQKDEVEAFTNSQDHLGSEHLAATIRYLARQLPVYDATFEVTQSGVRCTQAVPAR